MNLIPISLLLSLKYNELDSDFKASRRVIQLIRDFNDAESC